MKLIKRLDIRPCKTGKHSNRWGLFLCPYCNQEIEKQFNNGKKAKSCGCMKGEFARQKVLIHGETNTRLFSIWTNMKTRCLNSNTSYYKNYGGRGITICNEWLEYISFRDWALANGYEDTLTIDRVDNNKNYEPSNCHFITRKENSSKTRNVKLSQLQVNEIRTKYIPWKYTQEKLAKKYNVSREHIRDIINHKRRID